MGFQPGRTFPACKPYQAAFLTSPPGWVTGHPSSKGTWLKSVSFPTPGPFPIFPVLGNGAVSPPGLQPGHQPGHHLFPPIPFTTESQDPTPPIPSISTTITLVRLPPSLTLLAAIATNWPLPILLHPEARMVFLNLMHNPS